MVYKYFEHKADIGIIGEGRSLEEAFQEAAKAMFEVMGNLNKIKPIKKIEIKTKAYDEKELFVEWLNELLAQKDINEMLFSKFEVFIEKSDNKYILKGYCFGEKINKKHELETEVKAATYSELKLTKNKKVIIQCILDI